VPAISLEREVRGRGYVAIAVLALLAACALERPPGVMRVTYACDQGRGFVARYERDGQVILELGDGERVLPEVAAIAGTRYDDGTYELQLNGRNATLRGTAATYSNCVARDSITTTRGPRADRQPSDLRDPEGRPGALAHLEGMRDEVREGFASIRAHMATQHGDAAFLERRVIELERDKRRLELVDGPGQS